MFRGGDELPLLHHAGGVTDAGHVASASFDRKAVQVGAMEYDSRSGTRGPNPQANRGAAMETHSRAGHSSTNCLLVCQGGWCKSFVVYQLTVMGRLLHVAKSPHSVVRPTGGTLTCSGGYRCLGVSREELGPVLSARLRFSAIKLLIWTAAG